jgi:methylated-DNA-protein-cysteine methyltransferase-like protein
MNPFTEKVIEIIKSIPPSKVMTYGQVAEWAGNPRGARQVSRILHSMSRNYDIPWQRVVNRLGEISLSCQQGGDLQRQLLEEEGVTFNESGKINLKVYRYTGS